ncbi:hypothetical protein ACVDG8_004965 [Mesorhizobium sp. ORM8.1]
MVGELDRLQRSAVLENRQIEVAGGFGIEVEPEEGMNGGHVVLAGFK